VGLSGSLPDRSDFPFEAFAERLPNLGYIILRLQPDPEIGSVPEESPKSKCSIWRNRPTLMDDIGNAACRNADGLGERPDRQGSRLELVTKCAARMNGKHEN
jgi:hypothetical protein